MSGTKNQILQIATRLVQENGYNAFSFNDISNELGIRKASIHYHFPTKTDLVLTIVSHYRERHNLALQQIEVESGSAIDKMRKFADLFVQTLGDNYLMCPSGMLASDVSVLPEPVLEQVQGFFLDSEQWLSRVLKEGVDDGQFKLTGKIQDHARTLFSSFEGALLAARAFTDQRRLTMATKQIINSILAKH